jgi:hypothetical protein
MLFRIPVGALVVPTSVVDLHSVVAATGLPPLHPNPGPVSARLRMGTTVLIAGPATSMVSTIAAARQGGAPIVVVGRVPDWAQPGDLVVPSNASMVCLGADDVGAAGDVVVVGDVHNCTRTLRRLLAELGVNPGVPSGDEPLVVFVGDFVDKGGGVDDDPLGALRLVRTLVRAGQGVAVRGNHEQMLVRRISGKSNVTASSRAAFEALSSAPDRGELLRFLGSLPLAVHVPTSTEPVVVAHANYSSALAGDNKAWWRHEQVCLFGNTSPDTFDGVVVHGHNDVCTPKVSVSDGSTRVNVDTGCFRGNGLTAYFVGLDPRDPDAYIHVPTDPADMGGEWDTEDLSGIAAEILSEIHT